MQINFRGLRPDDIHGRRGLRNPERGFRTEMYFSCIPGEIAGTCSCHSKRNKLDGREQKPTFQNIEIPGIPHLIRGNRLDAIEFSHAQWQDELDFLAYDGVSVMQSYCFLMKYDDGRPLPPEKLQDIESFFLKLREAGAKALLRFAYELSPSLCGPTGKTILAHLEQLCPLLRKYADVIYVLQCGFIGKFGEWHNSFHFLQDDVEFHRELLDAVLEALPPTRKTMLRCPKYKMALYGDAPVTEEIAFSGAPAGRIGHFNDGFMAGQWHGGTFRLKEQQAEERYLEQESRFVPMDGELFWRDLNGLAVPADALVNFARWHYDTFGMVHSHSLFEQDRYSMDLWKEIPVDPLFLKSNRLEYDPDYFTGASGKHVWRSYYEYIRDHLGYRLKLERAILPDEIRPGGEFAASVELTNYGFSAPANPRPIRLVLAGKERTVQLEFPCDVRRWYGGGMRQKLEVRITLPADLPAGEYRAGLWLPDAAETISARPEYAIRCANALDFENGVNWFGAAIVCR